MPILPQYANVWHLARLKISVHQNSVVVRSNG